MKNRRMETMIQIVGYLADQIVGYFGSKLLGVELIYVVESKPLGTGGAIRLSIEKCFQDYMFVFNGDTYLEVDNVERLWQVNRFPIIVGREVEDTSRYGRLLTEKGRISGFAEKEIAGRGLINAGCYVLKKDQLADFPANLPFSFESDYLIRAVENSTFNLFVTTGDFIDIGIPEDYARAD